MAGALAADAPRQGVLLGLGGAGIAKLLRAANPSLKLDVVEIDQAVVTLAKRYFGYAPRPGERAYVEDAAVFVTRAEQKGRHDLVFVDCFGESFIPPSLLTNAFFKSVNGLLSPRGVVVANLWSTHPEFQSIVRRYRAIYQKVWILGGAISGNTVIIAGADTAVADPSVLHQRARALDARKAIPFLVAPHTLRLRPN